MNNIGERGPNDEEEGRGNEARGEQGKCRGWIRVQAKGDAIIASRCQFFAEK